MATQPRTGLMIGLGVGIVAIFVAAMVMLSTGDEDPSRQYEPVTEIKRPPPEAAPVVKPDAALAPAQ